MTHKQERETVQMDRIIDLLVEDLFAASDKDILAEATAEHADVKAEVQKLYVIAQEAIFNHGKAKLETAKKALAAKRGVTKNELRISSLERKKQIINSIRNANDNLKQKVTMAARNENELSESDLDIYLQSLYDLGVIDEEGNILCD